MTANRYDDINTLLTYLNYIFSSPLPEAAVVINTSIFLHCLFSQQITFCRPPQSHIKDPLATMSDTMTPISTTPPSHPLSLMGIPVEIRQKIWGFTVTEYGPEVTYDTNKPPPIEFGDTVETRFDRGTIFSLLVVNKEIHEEVADIVFRHVAVNVGGLPRYPDFTDDISDMGDTDDTDDSDNSIGPQDRRDLLVAWRYRLLKLAPRFIWRVRDLRIRYSKGHCFADWEDSLNFREVRKGEEPRSLGMIRVMNLLSLLKRCGLNPQSLSLEPIDDAFDTDAPCARGHVCADLDRALENMSLFATVETVTIKFGNDYCQPTWHQDQKTYISRRLGFMEDKKTTASDLVLRNPDFSLDHYQATTDIYARLIARMFGNGGNPWPHWKGHLVGWNEDLNALEARQCELRSEVWGLSKNGKVIVLDTW